MQETLKRARELLPAIIITVLSMIQALALELFWNRFEAADYLWAWDAAALVGWAQYVLMLLGIVQIWLLYVSLMLRFSWIPSMGDTTIPFAVGLLEFAMIDLLGPESIGPWYFILGLLYGLLLATTRTMLRKARRDTSNAWFFANIPPFDWTDYLRDAVAVVILVTLGAVLWAFDPGWWLVVASLGFAGVALVLQLLITRRFWLPLTGDAAAEEPEP